MKISFFFCFLVSNYWLLKAVALRYLVTFAQVSFKIFFGAYIYTSHIYIQDFRKNPTFTLTTNRLQYFCREIFLNIIIKISIGNSKNLNLTNLKILFFLIFPRYWFIGISGSYLIIQSF